MLLHYFSIFNPLHIAVDTATFLPLGYSWVCLASQSKVLHTAWVPTLPYKFFFTILKIKSLNYVFDTKSPFIKKYVNATLFYAFYDLKEMCQQQS